MFVFLGLISSVNRPKLLLVQYAQAWRVGLFLPQGMLKNVTRFPGSTANVIDRDIFFHTFTFRILFFFLKDTNSMRIMRLINPTNLAKRQGHQLNYTRGYLPAIVLPVLHITSSKPHITHRILYSSK